MEQDIKTRIEKDFGSNASAAISLVEEMENDLKTSPRISRCVVHLAKGDISELQKAIDNAKTDWRDVILWAETTSFEFNKPFKS